MKTKDFSTFEREGHRTAYPHPYSQGVVKAIAGKRYHEARIHVEPMFRARNGGSAVTDAVRELWDRWDPVEWAAKSRKPAMRFLPFALAVFGNVLEWSKPCRTFDHVNPEKRYSVRKLARVVEMTAETVTHREWKITVPQMDNFLRNFTFSYGKNHQKYLEEYQATGRVNLRQFCFFTVRLCHKLVMDKFSQRKHRSLKHGCCLDKGDFHLLQKRWKSHRIAKTIELLNWTGE